MSIESLAREFDAGMTKQELLARHAAELSAAKRKRLSKDRVESILRYHRQDLMNWKAFEQTQRMMELAEIGCY